LIRVALYLVAVVATNFAFIHLGVWSFLGVSAPWAAFLAGLPLAFRDAVQRRYGRYVAAIVILVACGITAFLSPALAFASAAAFLCGELLDLTVFTALERKGFLKAAIASNTVGAVVDSLVFLSIAFGSLAFLPGQVIAKVVSSSIVSLVLWRTRSST